MLWEGGPKKAASKLPYIKGSYLHQSYPLSLKEPGTAGSGSGKNKSEMSQSGVKQTVILQNYRYFRHLAKPSGVVTNLGIYISFQIKK